MLYEFDGRTPQVADGAYVSDTATVIGDVVIGPHCYIGHGAILRGDYGRIEIGPGTAVEEGVIIHAPPERVCRIGEKVTLGHGAVIHGQRLGDCSVVGMGAVLSILSEIGEWTIVAEGAVVKIGQAIPDGMVAVGNPAAVVREIADRDREMWSGGKQIYIDLAEKYLRVGLHPVAPDGRNG
mgnify:FL=1